MPRWTAGWKLEGGLSRILETLAVEIGFEAGPFSADGLVRPLSQLKQPRPIDLTFALRRAASGRLADRVRWRLTPQGSLSARILFPGNAFLGNFRVAQGQFAIQWSAVGLVEAGVDLNALQGLWSARTRTRLNLIWVTVVDESSTVRDALFESWRRFVDPFDGDAMGLLAESQVTQANWTGEVRLAFGLRWRQSPGWAFGVGTSAMRWNSTFFIEAGAEARAQSRSRGSFSLRLSRRGTPQARLLQERSRDAGMAFELAAAAGHRGTIRVPPPLREVTRSYRSTALAAVRRRLSLTAALELHRSTRRRQLAQIRWKKEAADFSAYSQLLRGDLPSAGPDWTVSGTLESVRSRRFEVRVNFFDWTGLGRSSRRVEEWKTTVSPSGEVVVERAAGKEKESYRWDQMQWLRLWLRWRKSDLSEDAFADWTFQLRRRFQAGDLRRVLRGALHSGSISEFELPGDRRFPMHLELIWRTRLEAKGLEAVRGSSDAEVFSSLARAFELAEPEKYASGSFWRDWIDSEALRQEVRRNPAQAHLETQYPVPGRSAAQRRFAVQAFRRADRFLRQMRSWREAAEWLEEFDAPLEIPVFLFFHLLCPPNLRRSAVTMTGDLNRVWGDETLLEDSAARG